VWWPQQKPPRSSIRPSSPPPRPTCGRPFFTPRSRRPCIKIEGRLPDSRPASKTHRRPTPRANYGAVELRYRWRWRTRDGVVAAKSKDCIGYAMSALSPLIPASPTSRCSAANIRLVPRTEVSNCSNPRSTFDHYDEGQTFVVFPITVDASRIPSSSPSGLPAMYGLGYGANPTFCAYCRRI
jgi:hypothetical protein